MSTVCDFLLYEDDLKLFKPIIDPSRCEAVQNNLFVVSEWCKENSIELNLAKCEIIFFSWKSDIRLTVCQYAIGSNFIKRVHVVKDLRVLLGRKITLRVHINQIISRAKCVLGLV